VNFLAEVAICLAAVKHELITSEIFVRFLMISFRQSELIFDRKLCIKGFIQVMLRRKIEAIEFIFGLISEVLLRKSSGMSFKCGHAKVSK
jgi:hypothetical protein